MRTSVSVPVFAASLLACGAACSPFREVVRADRLEPGERLIVGEIRAEGGDFGDWTSGAIYSGAQLLLDYELPVHGGRVSVKAGDGHQVRREAYTDGGLRRKGGLFRVAIKNQPTYLLAVQVDWTAILVSGFTVYPLLVRVTPSPFRCQYIGTITVRYVNRETVVAIHDDLERFRKDHPHAVDGCSLADAPAEVLDPVNLRQKPLETYLEAQW